MQTATTYLNQTFANNQTTVLELIADNETPVTAFEKLAQAESSGFLFESAQSSGASSRFSILGVDPLETVCIKDGRGYYVQRDGKTSATFSVKEPLDFLRQRAALNSRNFNNKNVPDFLPFSGGFVGYLGYPLSSYLYGIKKQADVACDIPDLLLAFYDSAIVFDHLHRKLYIISHRSPDHAQELCRKLQQPSRLPRLSRPAPVAGPGSAAPNTREILDKLYAGTQSSHTREKFIESVGYCKEKICAGEAFQIVLSQRFSLQTEAEPLSIYRVLQSLNPSPYGYFLQFPEFCYLGSSPETLVSCRKRQLTLRALAGTRRRGQSKEEDMALEAELISSEKEMAEHMMLVDLGRNDLGRVARPGTVLAKNIASVVRFENVMHLSTEIVAELAAGLDAYDAVAGCFPAGTVSGAPKIRAMQILSELEPEQRGIYAGMVGYFDLQGNCDGAIAIRSALLAKGTAHLNAGAGIVYESDPDMEYEETRTKASPLIKAIKLAEHLKENEICN